MKASFISFPASDYTESTNFYENIIGLNILRKHNGEPHKFTNYDLGGVTLKIYEWTEKYYGSGHSGLFIETEELDETVNRVREAGKKATDIVIHKWGGRCSSITDPFGNIFDLIDTNRKGNS